MNKQIRDWSQFATEVAEYLAGMQYTNDDVYGFHSHFALAVIDHIEGYVLPQYGEHIDNSTDLVSTLSDPVSYCTSAIERYKQRLGRNQRPHNDGRDCLKRAHYAQLRGTARGEFSPDDFYEAWYAYMDWLALGGNPANDNSGE